MMKFSKTFLMVLAVVVLLCFVGVMIYNVIEINQLQAVASANRSTEFKNPRNWVLIGAALGVAGGFLLGVSLAMPSKTFKARYEELRKSEAINEAKQNGYSSSTGIRRPTEQ